MDDTKQSARANDLLAVVVAMLSFSAANAIWFRYDLEHKTNTYALVVQLVAASGVGLVLLAWKLRQGRVTMEELGFGLRGWTAGKRLFGLFFSLFLPGVMLLTLEEDPALTAANVFRPTWGEYCFWFVVAAPASIAELLVFLLLPVCLLQRRFREQGRGRLVTVLVPLVVSSVTFGLFHYTHDERWHPFVYPLMVEMLFVGGYFLYARNFHLALLLHNATAGMGFARGQYFPPEEALKQSDYTPFVLGTILAAFLIPWLLLHVWEWSWQRRTGGE
jgi:hypothetical protein